MGPRINDRISSKAANIQDMLRLRIFSFMMLSTPSEKSCKRKKEELHGKEGFLPYRAIPLFDAPFFVIGDHLKILEGGFRYWEMVFLGFDGRPFSCRNVVPAPNHDFDDASCLAGFHPIELFPVLNQIDIPGNLDQAAFPDIRPHKAIDIFAAEYPALRENGVAVFAISFVDREIKSYVRNLFRTILNLQITGDSADHYPCKHVSLFSLKIYLYIKMPAEAPCKKAHFYRHNIQS